MTPWIWEPHMYSRSAINDMLTELAADLPRMQRDAESFFPAFEERTRHLLAAAAPADEAYVQAVLQEFLDRSGANGCCFDRHAA